MVYSGIPPFPPRPSNNSMEFRSQVQVWSHTGHFLFAARAILAAQLIEFKRATVEIIKGKKVAVLRLVEHQEKAVAAELKLWPGSYGIEQITFGGGTYYQHKPHWDKALKTA